MRGILGSKILTTYLQPGTKAAMDCSEESLARESA